MGTLAFFPWLKIAAPLAAGGFEMLPYRRGEPFSGEPAITSTVASVLAPYWNRFDLPGKDSVILRRTGHGLLDDLDEGDMEDLYAFSEWLALSGLSARRYFGHDGYSNRDNFRLIVQRFSGEAGGAAVVSRRRDGTTTAFAPEKYYRVIRPEHVHGNTVDVDVGLLRALLNRPEGGSTPDLYDASVTFNMANTDAPYAPPHMELILSASAFQLALGCKTTSDRELGEKFEAALTPSVETTTSSGRLGTLKNQPTNSSTVRQMWIRDLYRLRGDLAHGKVNPRFPSIWKMDEHLLLSAFVFPLVSKSLLAAAGAYVLTDDDAVSIDAFERLAADPDLGHWDPTGTCPWNAILWEAYRGRAHAAAMKALAATTP
jgi:hypothetical protein